MFSVLVTKVFSINNNILPVDQYEVFLEPDVKAYFM